MNGPTNEQRTISNIAFAYTRTAQCSFISHTVRMRTELVERRAAGVLAGGRTERVGDGLGFRPAVRSLLARTSG